MIGWPWRLAAWLTMLSLGMLIGTHSSHATVDHVGTVLIGVAILLMIYGDRRSRE